MKLRIATFNVENLDDGDFSQRKKMLQNQLNRINADILLLQEVHAQDGQLKVIKELVENTQYKNYEMVYTTQENSKPFAQRNLITLSKFGVIESEQFKHEYIGAPSYKASTGELKSNQITWERPALYSKIGIEDKIFHCVNVHLKSKNPTSIPGQKADRFSWKTVPGWAEGFFISSMRRVGQALEVRTFIDTLFEQDGHANIIVAGDFNDDFYEVAVEAILGRIENTGNLKLTNRELIPAEFTVPEPSRFSLYHRGKKNMLDHVLISQSLVSYYSHTEIHNEMLKDESIAFATDDKYIGSDHAPVVAEFTMP